MITAWTKHCKTEEEKKELQESIRRSGWVLELFNKNILDQMTEDLNVVEINPKTYELPNWDYRQAHNNGYRQCLELIKKLTTLDQKDKR